MKIKNKLLLMLVMLVCGFAAAWAQQQQQHVTVAPTQHGTVAVDNSAPYSGETVHLTVTPDHGYKLANLQVTCVGNGNVVTLDLTTISDGHYAFTMPDLDVTVTATFEQILYTVTVEDFPKDEQGFGVGFVMVDNVGHSDNRFAEGETVSLLVSADIGYELTTLEVTYKVGDEVIPVPVTPAENNNYTFVMPAADVYVHWIVAKALYTITFAEHEHGVVSADKEVAQYGEEVTLQATTDDHYILTGFSVKYTNGYPVTVNGHKFIMPPTNVIASAIIDPVSYNITVQDTEHGTVTAPAKADYNTQVEITVSPAVGYKFGSIKVVYTQETGEMTINPTLTESGSYTFTMPGANVRVVVTFEPIAYNITVAPTEHGTVTAPESALSGAQVSVTATPDTGYEIDQLYYSYRTEGDGADQKSDIKNGTFTMPATDVTIVATFKPVTYNITVAPTEHGTVSVPANASFDTPVEFTVKPDEGYRLGSLKVIYTQGPDETEVPLSLTESGSYTFTMPDADVTVLAAFEPIAYNITVAPTEHGTVTAPESALSGAQVSVTATPDTGYEIDQLYYSYRTEGDGADQKSDIKNGTFTMPATDVTIVAIFKPVTYNITVAPAEHGTVSVPANASFATPVEFTVKPDEGYRLGSLKVIYTQGPDETEIPLSLTESGSYTFTMPDADVTVLAAFEPQVYNIATAIYPDDEAGTIQVAASAAFGTEVEVIATPAEGYILKDLYYTYYVDGGVHEPILGIYNGKFYMPATDVTVVAMFEREQATQYNVAVSIDIVNGNIEADKSTAAVGETVTLTVTPDNGYMLETITVSYDDGTVAQPETGNAPRRIAQNVPVSKVDDVHYTFQMPAGAVTVSATFVKETTTAISDVDAATGAQVRYYDLQGRYIGTTLDAARSGIYVTADGRKVIK